MAVRLGTQDWINPGPFQAAAEMVVDAGRSTGAGIAAVGAGIGQGLQAYGAKQERKQRRQDLLGQQGIENARADRAEDRMVKQSKIAALEGLVTASKMKVDMARQQYEAMGTPEAEAAYMQAVQEGQNTLNLYQMGLSNHATPTTPVTDYLGVGRAMGPNGWPVGQSPSEKAARGEPTGDPDVYWNKQDYAESEAAQARVGVEDAPRQAPTDTRQPSMEAAAELTTAADFLAAANAKRNEAARIRAGGKNRRTEAQAAVLENDAKFLEANAQMKHDDEKSAREQAEKVAGEAAKVKEDNEALRALGLRPEFAVDLPGPAAALLLEKHKAGVVSEARLPSQMALVDRRADRADAKQEDAQAFTMEKMAKAQEYSKARMAQAAEQRRAIAAEAREAGVPMDKFSAIYREMDALAGQQDQLFGRAKDLWSMGRVGEAQAVLDTAQRMDGELNDMMAQVREARMNIGKSAAPAAKAIDPTLARAIFDREVQTRGIDPKGDEARQLARDIKDGKVR